MCVCLAVMFGVIAVPHLGRADVEWSITNELPLDVTPLDVSTSSDGKWIFVLTPGEIVLYSSPDNKLINRIPVDKMFDRLAYSAHDDTLILSSSTGKALKFIHLDSVFKFDTTGLAFKGPANAPVTITVFSDYQ